MCIPNRFALCFALALASTTAHAAEQTLTLDSSATEIGFVLGATLHEAKGTVKLERGVIRFDTETGTAAGEIAIDAASASTDEPRRDRKMHAEVLEDARYPSIVFRPERVEVKRRDAAGADIDLSGTLEMHGERHALTLPATLVAADGRIEIESRFRVPYVDWGMKNVSSFVMRVDPFVDVTVRAKGVIAAP